MILKEVFAFFMGADSPAKEEERMQAAIEEHRRRAKSQTRREMGLPE